MFVDLGVPVTFRCDGGPQFSSKEFKDFLKKWGVKLKQSTPYHPQSNGHAESTVKAMKHLLIKTAENGNIESEEFQKGLMEFRNTPRSGGLSPAQIVFGHPTRTLVPAHSKAFDPKWSITRQNYDNKYYQDKLKAKKYYDRSSTSLKELKMGSEVLVQDASSKKWDKIGKIISIGKFRDYLIKTPSGQIMWRNRKFLKPL